METNLNESTPLPTVSLRNIFEWGLGEKYCSELDRTFFERSSYQIMPITENGESKNLKNSDNSTPAA